MILNLREYPVIIRDMSAGKLVVAFGTAVAFVLIASGQKPPKIEVTSEEVAINVRFTDRFNRGITDIQPREIRIFEDGKEQKLARFFRSAEPFYVALLLDMSPSTTDLQQGIRDRSADFVAQMPEGNRLLLITFEDKVFIDCDWTSDLQKVMDAVENLEWNKKADSTHLWECVSLVAQKKLKKDSPRKAMILYTDGIDMGSDGFSAQDSLDIIEESGVLVYPIQFDSRDWWVRSFRRTGSRSPDDPDYDPRYPDGRRPQYDPRNPRSRRPQYDPRDPRSRRPYPPDEPDDDDPTIPNPIPPVKGSGGIVLGPGVGTAGGRSRQEAQWKYEGAQKYLRKLAEVSSGRYFETPGINALENAYARIIQELSDVYTITYIPLEHKTDGQFHRVKIDVTRPNVAALTTKGGYWAR
jgi:hypothetical protein